MCRSAALTAVTAVTAVTAFDEPSKEKRNGGEGGSGWPTGSGGEVANRDHDARDATAASKGDTCDGTIAAGLDGRKMGSSAPAAILSNIIHLECSADDARKSAFVRTCDAMLHARQVCALR